MVAIDCVGRVHVWATQHTLEPANSGGWRWWPGMHAPKGSKRQCTGCLVATGMLQAQFFWHDMQGF